MGGTLKNVNRPMTTSRGYSGSNDLRNRSVHAEVAAYIKTRRARASAQDLADATMYVAKADIDSGGYRDSKPCKLCMKFLKRVGITRVFYTVPDGIAKLEY